MADSNIRQLGEARGSHVATVCFYRRPDGTIAATLEDMPPHVIEQDEEISARFTRLASIMMEGVMDVMRQAIRFDPDTRQDEEDIRNG